MRRSSADGGLRVHVGSRILAAGLVCTLVACARENVTEVVVRSVLVQPLQITVVEGSSVEFQALVADEGGTPLGAAAVEWSSDAPHVAFVDARGVARAISDGTARIRASFRGVTGDAILTVLPASTIQLVPETVTLYGGTGGDDPAPAQVFVGNEAGGALAGLRTEVQYHEARVAPWLQASLEARTTPTTIRLAPRIEGLPAGEHHATVLVRSETADVTPAPLHVRLFLAGFTIAETGGGTRVEESGAEDTLRVSLDAPASTPVILRVESADTTSLTVSPATLTFPPQVVDTPHVVVVRGVDNRIADGDREIPVRVSVAAEVQDPAWRSALPREVLVTVVDDDHAGISVRETAGGTVVREGVSTDTVLVSLTSEPEAGVEVRVAPELGSGLVATPARLVFSPVAWEEPRPVVFSVPDDVTAAGDRTHVVRFTAVAAPGSSYAAVEPVTVSVDVVDDDLAGVVFRRAGGGTEVVVREGGPPALLEVLLTARPVSNVVLRIDGMDPSDLTVAPELLTFTPETWSVPRVVRATAVDDRVVDGDRIHTLRVSAVPASSAGAFHHVSATVVVRTIDNDLPGFIVSSTGSTGAAPGSVERAAADPGASSGPSPVPPPH